MEKRRSCPACGGELTKNENKCPVCGLEGLNQLFLSRADYKKWVKEVLEPHMAALPPKVFAGKAHGMILTAWGDLYGIGNNQANQLTDAEQEQYDQPVLMARDVVCAAAGKGYSAYVTRDGQLHWQSVVAEDLPAFSNVRAVYAECWRERFWVVQCSGEIWCFGNNYDELLEERRKIHSVSLPEISGVKYGFGPPIYWLDNDSTSWDAAERCVKSEAYRDMLEKYGEKNVELDVNEIEPDPVRKAFYFVSQRGFEVYRPIITVWNNWIYEPVLFRKAWREDMPHRVYGRPVMEAEYLADGWEDLAGVAKAVTSGGRFEAPEFGILEDKAVMTYQGKKLKWMEQTAVDVARGEDMVLIACANGDILWSNSLTDVAKGRMNVCRLPKQQ